MRHHLIRSVSQATASADRHSSPSAVTIALLALLPGAACREPAAVDRPPTTGEHRSTLGTVTANRPLVTILTNLPGPTDPDPGAQWVASSPVQVGLAIPDDSTSGVSSDVKLTDISDGACAALFGLWLDLDVSHPRPADLTVTISTVTRNGATVLASLVAFDGPALAQGQPASSITLPSGIDVTPLLHNTSDCARFRVTITDTVAGKTGSFNSWFLQRRDAVFPWAHQPAYYEHLLFGGGAPQYNVHDFFDEESRGNFVFSDAGVFGPVDYTGWMFRDDGQHHQDAVWLLEAAGFDFAAYDSNGDGWITDDELELLAMDNGQTNGGANRPAIGGCDTLRNSSLHVCSQIVFIGEQPDFETLCHELSHSIGTHDLYGDNWNLGECDSWGLTVMSCTEPAPPDFMDTLYHDPWHRSKLGWYTPTTPDVTRPEGGSVLLGDETFLDPQGQHTAPARLSNPEPTGFAAVEYYLFEFRAQHGHDASENSAGIVAWHVSEDAAGDPWTGIDRDQPEGHAIYAVSPDNPVGGSTAWTAAPGYFQLHWADGGTLPYTFWVEPRAGNAAVLHWTATPGPWAAPLFGLSTVTAADPPSRAVAFGTLGHPAPLLTMSWHHGSYDLTTLDAFVPLAPLATETLANGSTLYTSQLQVTLGGLPCDAGGCPGHAPPAAWTTWSQLVTSWTALIDAVAARYTGASASAPCLGPYELWNEANATWDPSHWFPADRHAPPGGFVDNYDAMKQLAAYAYGALHGTACALSAQSPPMLITPSVVGTIAGGANPIDPVASDPFAADNWMAAYLASGAGQYADGGAYHGYVAADDALAGPSATPTQPMPEQAQASLPVCGNPAVAPCCVSDPTRFPGYSCYGSVMDKSGRMRDVFDADPTLRGKPMFDTEGSWGTAAPGSDTLQAAWLARWYLLQAGLGTSRNLALANWFAWGGSSIGTIESSLGPTLAGVAYSTVADWVTRANALAPCTRTGSIMACTIAAPTFRFCASPGPSPCGYQAMVVWSTAGQTAGCSGTSCPVFSPSTAAWQYRDLRNAVHGMPATFRATSEPRLIEGCVGSPRCIDPENCSGYTLTDGACVAE
jgi:M6 family metalloprotease-like protein